MYAPPKLLQAHEFAKLPELFYQTGSRSDWVDYRGGGALHSFLEGPSFDRKGNLYCVDVAHSRIFKISPSGDWELFVQYDGIPNGLKIHRDGRIFVADRRLGLLVFDQDTAVMSVLAGYPNFRGLNDLSFSLTGDLYFTDPGESALNDCTGRVYRLSVSGDLDLICDDLAGPNGLVLNKDESALLVAVTLSNSIVRIPLKKGFKAGRVGTFIQMSGSPAGPDGMALDIDGSVVVVHAGFGTVWVFSNLGEPLYRINTCAGMRVTNVAYGGPDGKTLYITEAESGVIMKVDLPVAGHVTYGLS